MHGRVVGKTSIPGNKRQYQWTLRLISSVKAGSIALGRLAPQVQQQTSLKILFRLWSRKANYLFEKEKKTRKPDPDVRGNQDKSLFWMCLYVGVQKMREIGHFRVKPDPWQILSWEKIRFLENRILVKKTGSGRHQGHITDMLDHHKA